jgi:DUF1680 family protein
MRARYLVLSGLFVVATLLSVQRAVPAADDAPAPVLPKVKDVSAPADPSNVTLEWFIGERVQANIQGRLLVLDPDLLLEGFRKRPGKQAWVGEHVGKWLHSASLAWAYSRDSALRKKLDLVVKELLATQGPDGYLGTYVPEQRFGLTEGADWDVWVHKYCILGLLTYHQYRKQPAALEGARKAGDLLLATFGPGKKDIIEAGTHVGMAATSVLEPMVLLYAATGDPRYLEFAKYLVAAYEHPKGPRIVTSLADHGQVNRTANCKAYEMMSNLVGLLELYRYTGEAQYLEVTKRAWKDIVEHRMYITGGVSVSEHFQADGVFPNVGAVAETCANVTWEQLNLQLLRLTGEAKYADVLERLLYNHILGAQKPDGTAFCYFTPLEGKKPYDTAISCCASSGPRGLALIPTFAFTAREDSIDVNLFVRGDASFTLANGETYKIEQRTRFPSGSKIFVVVRAASGGNPCKYRVRVPSWATPSGRFEDASWKEYDVEARFDLEQIPRVIAGEGSNAGRVAILRGPMVYSLESRFNPDLAGGVVLAGNTVEALGLDAVGAKEKALYSGQALLKAKGIILRPAGGGPPKAIDLFLSDFASAGADGGSYRVWLPVQGSAEVAGMSRLAYGVENASREGNMEDSISDGNPTTYRVTFDNAKADEDWFSVEVDEPVEIDRVAFLHGKSFHDGGWFDASSGKPRVEVKATKDGAWEVAATLEAYPATTSTDDKGLQAGQRFDAKLSQARKVVAVRIVGKPATGDRPAQAFSSAAEIGAWGPGQP